VIIGPRRQRDHQRAPAAKVTLRRRGPMITTCIQEQAWPLSANADITFRRAVFAYDPQQTSGPD
jgi:hypothetical protein